MTDEMTRGSTDKNVSAMISEDCVLSAFQRRANITCIFVSFRTEELYLEDQGLRCYSSILICSNPVKRKFRHRCVILLHLFSRSNSTLSFYQNFLLIWNCGNNYRWNISHFFVLKFDIRAIWNCWNFMYIKIPLL